MHGVGLGQLADASTSALVDEEAGFFAKRTRQRDLGAARSEPRPSGTGGDVRSPRRSAADGRQPEGFQGVRRDGDGETRRSFRREPREARDGGNATEARRREPAGN